MCIICILHVHPKVSIYNKDENKSDNEVDSEDDYHVSDLPMTQDFNSQKEENGLNPNDDIMSKLISDVNSAEEKKIEKYNRQVFRDVVSVIIVDLLHH